MSCWLCRTSRHAWMLFATNWTRSAPPIGPACGLPQIATCYTEGRGGRVSVPCLLSSEWNMAEAVTLKKKLLRSAIAAALIRGKPLRAAQLTEAFAPCLVGATGTTGFEPAVFGLTGRHVYRYTTPPGTRFTISQLVAFVKSGVPCSAGEPPGPHYLRTPLPLSAAGERKGDQEDGVRSKRTASKNLTLSSYSTVPYHKR